jgi:TonB family protein
MEGKRAPHTAHPGPPGSGARAAGPPGSRPRPSVRPAGTLRPPRDAHNPILPAALILSSILHVAGFTLFLMHPVARQKPAFKEPMLVKLIELPKGEGGATVGTPGRAEQEAPPRPEPPRPEKPKTTLPGKVPPPPSASAPVRSTRPGQAVGLGRQGQPGLGGTGSGVILDEPTFQYEWYKARLEDSLRSHWHKPVLNLPKSVSASVHFAITASGEAQDVQIVSSSNIPAFDQSVLRAVYSSVPFPRFPPQYDAPALGVLYTFELLPDSK